jgi:hypothetical protein
MIMRGATIKEVQEILGHRDVKMTLRYAHLSQEHKKKAVNLLNGLTAVSQKPTCHINVTNLKSAKSDALQPVVFSGGADRDRTDDLMTASHALSQLSYSPEFAYLTKRSEELSISY